MARPRIFPDHAMTDAERQRRRRARLRGDLPPWAPKSQPQPPQFEDAFLSDLQVLDLDELPDS
jgi:hypothetical protein